MLRMTDDLYDLDFYAWTQAQAEALRRRGRGGNALDYDNLAEEVGDMGLREYRECFSRVRTILEHFMKLEASSAEEPRRGWTETILTQQADLADALTPSIRHMLVQDLERARKRAFSLVSRSFKLYEPDALQRLDPARRWTLEEIFGA